jgi:FAD:protein FMN transferase
LKNPSESLRDGALHHSDAKPSSPSRWPVFRHEAMATHFEIAIATDDYDYAGKAARTAFRELDRLESELSRFIETSDISRINRLARGGSTVVGLETFECLLLAADVALATGRAFDPGYGSERDAALAPDALAFSLDPASHTVTSHTSRLNLDLGAVGKGYALDRLADLLREWGLTAAVLNSGDSTVLAPAPPPGEAGWIVGLGEGRAYRRFPLVEGALSGSGTAEKGTHVHDPRTGQPAARTSRVWALAPSACHADALSTAFFVMTEADVAAFCAAHPQIGAALAAPDEELIVHGALRRELANASSAPKNESG